MPSALWSGYSFQVCYYKRTGINRAGFFENEDLKTARVARRAIANTEKLIYDNPFDIANELDAEIVLAHPIRTSIKIAGRNSAYEKIEAALDELLLSYVNAGGKAIEWEFLDDELLLAQKRYPSLDGHYKCIRDRVYKYMEMFGLKCIWGSDTHQIHPNCYFNWEKGISKDLGFLIPDWLSCVENMN